MLPYVFNQIISNSKYFEAHKPLLLRRVGVGPHPKAGLATMRKGQKGRCPNLLQSGGRGFSVFYPQIIPKTLKYNHLSLGLY